METHRRTSSLGAVSLASILVETAALLEVFANGRAVTTALLGSHAANRGIVVFAGGGIATLVSIDVFKLGSVTSPLDRQGGVGVPVERVRENGLRT